jgi:chaperonin GroEL
MAKEIIFGTDARARIKAGIDKAADAVKPTLGAVGMTAMIEFPGLDPIQADDGVTILKNIELEDQYENMGVQTLRKAAVRTSQEGGDGTATTTVLTQALVEAAFKEVEQDPTKVREIRERLERGLDKTLSQLKELKRDVTEDDIERIATISSLDPEVAKLIADTIKRVGINGVVTVERGAQLGYTKEVVKGARFESGLISPFFINDHENRQTVLENAYIVLVDRKISMNEQIIGLLNSIGTGSDILFIATDVDSVALGTLTHNAVNGIAKIACVRNPYQASPARDFLFDIAALTGAQVISEERGMKLNDATVELCGKAEKVIVTKDTTTIIGGMSNDSLYARVKDLEREISQSTSEYEKIKLKDRLAQLTGGIGVIRVGAYTDTEFNAKKYKFQNAINAAQAALQEGILPGGGIALWQVASKHGKTMDKMFHQALIKPFRQMAKNAGVEPDGWDFKDNQGYDFKSKKVVDMFDAGIIDPFKVTRLALESATAIAMGLVGTETVIVTKKDKE